MGHLSQSYRKSSLTWSEQVRTRSEEPGFTQHSVADCYSERSVSTAIKLNPEDVFSSGNNIRLGQRGENTC